MTGESKIKFQPAGWGGASPPSTIALRATRSSASATLNPELSATVTSRFCNVMFRVAALDHFGSLRLAHLLYGPAAVGPVLEAAEVVDAVIAHVLENLTAERRAAAGAAIDDYILVLGEILVVRGRIGIGAKFQEAARDVDGTGDFAALFHFRRFAHVDNERVALRDHLPGLRRRDPRHRRIGGIHQLFQIGRHVLLPCVSLMRQLDMSV